MTRHFAIACGTTNGIKCANENSDKDYLSSISLENENMKERGLSWMKNWQKFLRSDLEQHKMRIFENMFYPQKIYKTLESKLTLKFGEESDMKLSKPICSYSICRLADDLHKNRTEKNESYTPNNRGLYL